MKRRRRNDLFRPAAVVVGFILLYLYFHSSSSPPSKTSSALTAPPAVESRFFSSPRIASDFGGFHNTSLTHVIVILSTQQEIDEFSETVSVWWHRFPPCVQKDSPLSGCSRNVYPQDRTRPRLLLLYPVDTSISQLHREMDFSATVQKCFETVRFAVMVTDISVEEALLTGLYVQEDVGYVLLLYSRVRPIRSDWLSALSVSVLFPVPLYWVIAGFPSSIFPVVNPTTQVALLIRLSFHDTENSRSSTRLQSKSFPSYYVHTIRPFLLRRLNNIPTHWSLETQVQAFLFYGRFSQYHTIRLDLVHRLMVSPLLTLSPFSTAVLAFNPDFMNLDGIDDTSSTLLPHQDRVTHVVVAFNSVPSQWRRLKHTITSFWERFPPCAGVEDTDLLQNWRTLCSSSSSSLKSESRPELVIMLSRRSMLELNVEAEKEDRTLKHRVYDEILPLLSSSSTQCFSRISVCLIRLTPRMDSYLTGSRILFERFLGGECTGNASSHVVYMEPDSRPLHTGWLTTLSASISFPNPESWVLGSVFRGSDYWTNWDLSLGWAFHVNGNAVYQVKKKNSTTRSMTFADFYFHQVRPFMVALQQTERTETAMDIDVTHFVSSLLPPNTQSDHEQFLKKLVYDAHLRVPHEVERPFQFENTLLQFALHTRYTNLISNQYKSVWDAQVENQAQFVHGGYCAQC